MRYLILLLICFSGLLAGQGVGQGFTPSLGGSVDTARLVELERKLVEIISNSFPEFRGIDVRLSNDTLRLGLDINELPVLASSNGNETLVAYDPDSDSNVRVDYASGGTSAQGLSSYDGAYELGVDADDFSETSHQVSEDRYLRGQGTNLFLWNMIMTIGGAPNTTSASGPQINTGAGYLSLTGQRLISSISGSFRNGLIEFQSGGQSGFQRWWKLHNTAATLSGAPFTNNDIGAMVATVSTTNAASPNITTSGYDENFKFQRGGQAVFPSTHTTVLRFFPHWNATGSVDDAIATTYLLPKITIPANDSVIVKEYLGANIYRDIKETTGDNGIGGGSILYEMTIKAVGTGTVSYSRYMVGWGSSGIQVDPIFESQAVNAPRLKVGTFSHLILRTNNEASVANVSILVNRIGDASNSPGVILSE